MSREKKPVVSYADVEHSDCDASDSEAQYAEQQQARGYVPVVPRRRQDDAERALIARDGAWADAYVALYATADHAGAALDGCGARWMRLPTRSQKRTRRTRSAEPRLDGSATRCPARRSPS